MTVSERHSLSPGTRFGRYELVRYIGAGGMGGVYEAKHVDLKKRVALKALRSAVVDNAEAHSRFLREGEAAARIRHPNVVEVFDVGIEHGIPYLVMELLEGEDLGALLQREGRLSVERIANTMLPVLAAVATAHEKGVLHRDLKPENIFLAKTPHGMVTPKLLDFGISKLVGTQEALSLTGGGAILGTPLYMSPEQATKSRGIDARSDQYSLGVIMYECCTNQDPFKGETLYDVLQAIVAGDFPTPSFYQPDLPAPFEAIILRAMSAEPEFRFPNLPTMGRSLLQFADPRDRAIWSPAFEPERTLGAPLNPSVPPLPLTTRKQQRDATTLSRAAGERDAEITLPMRRTPLWGIAAGAALAVGVAAWWLFPPSWLESSGAVDARVGKTSRAQPAEPRPAPDETAPDRPAVRTTYRLAVRTVPRDADLELDGNPVGTGTLTLELPSDGKLHRLRVSARGYEIEELTFRDQPPPEEIVLTKAVSDDLGSDRATEEPQPRTPEVQPVHRPGTAEARLAPRSVPGPTGEESIPRAAPEPVSPPATVTPAPPVPPPPAEFSANKAPIID